MKELVFRDLARNGFSIGDEWKPEDESIDTTDLEGTEHFSSEFSEDLHAKTSLEETVSQWLSSIAEYPQSVPFC